MISLVWNLNLKRKVPKVKRFNFVLVALFLIVALAYSANTDRFYQGTVTDPVYETYTQVTYRWVYTVPTVATDQMHSPAIFIGDMNDNDGMVAALVNAASDVNFIYHFSGDGTTWFTAVTPADLDATSSTTVVDTIGTEAGATDNAFRNANWLIIEADYGSAACEATEIVEIQISLRKDKYFIDSSGRMVTCAEVRTKRSLGWTNP
jgi:hypothetical protein